MSNSGNSGIKCGACKEIISSTEEKAICSICFRVFHTSSTCSGLTSEAWNSTTVDTRSQWTCHSCYPESRTRENSKKTNDRLLKLLNNIQLEHYEEQTESKNAITKMENTIDEVCMRLESLEEHYQKLKEENLRLKKRLVHAENDLTKAKEAHEKLNVQSRLNSIIISGIPIFKDEVPLQLAVKVSALVGVNISKTDVDVCYRMPVNESLRSNPPFFIKFVNRHVKTEVLRRYQLLRPNASDLGGSADVGISAAEHLTPTAHSLFCESFCLKRLGYMFLWVREGVVYARKSPEYPVEVIRSYKQLDEMIAAEQDSHSNKGHESC